MKSYFNITVIAEWCAFLAALLLLDRKTKEWRLFISFLFLTLCVETTGWYMHTQLKIFDNALPFNILMLISIAFILWFFAQAKALLKARNWLYRIAVVFIFFGLINLCFLQGFWRYNSFSESAGDIILSIVCCYFLFTLIKQSEHIDLLRFDYFWLTIGTLFYALGSALLYQFSYLLMHYYEQTKIDVGSYINYTLNLVFYSSLIIAFICTRKTTR